MDNDIAAIKTSAAADIRAADARAALDAVRVKYLGRKGSVTALGEQMRSLPKEEKPRIGQLLNDLRQSVQSALDARAAEFEAEEDAHALAGIDLTLPGEPGLGGGLHPLTQLMDRAIGICRRMGFALATGPDVETEWHCFDALNTPADHPARNEQDTFYFADGRLLRTHTSTVQIRVMESTPPPIRIIAPGSAFRRDEIDATHLSQFNQLEGLYVDADVSVADLRGTLDFFFRELLGADTEVRFRPHFFPFTEPSFEIDVRAKALAGGGRWLEMGGCGMVDPAVFEAVSATRKDTVFDPDKLSGFAFGMGLDRLAMILFAIPDIRMLVENDLRVLRQFA